MRISYNWLKERLPLELSAQDLAAHLLQLGFEVSTIEKRGPAFSGVVTAKVLSKEKHPNADKLAVCVVDDGTQKWSVVCGAPNVAAGQTVAFARVGAVLPGGLKIGTAKLRGVDSSGMICSSKELALGKDSGGILVLSEGIALGQDFAQTLGPADDILEVEIGPNRPDCLSHLGLARELAAFFRMPLKTEPSAVLPATGPCPITPVIRAPQACPRYLGRVLEGVTVGPSPDWLKQKLEAAGLRPINNVVDVTNFVLMDLGQPLHAFDADLLEGGAIEVRWGAAGETLKALDEKTYALTGKCLVIADAKKPVAIAGVMGGLESAVTGKTKRIFLESAHFFPPAVRKTSQLLRLRSDSSQRFERGTDIEAVETAARRACELILSLCGGAVTKAADVYPEKRQPTVIPATVKRLNDILGSNFSPDSVEASLRSIAASLAKEGETLRFTAPSYRGDLTSVWDLSEEVGRLLGYDNIPSRLPSAPMKAARGLPLPAAVQRAAARLAVCGLHEAYNYDLVSEKTLVKCRLPLEELARVTNPLSEDWAVLRPSLLPGLLNNAVTNINHGAEDVQLFEMGKTYAKKGKEFEETLHCAGLALGHAGVPHWRASKRRVDFYDLKGVIVDLLGGLPDLVWVPLDNEKAGKMASDPLFHPKASMRLLAPSGPFGAVGELHPAVSRAWGLEKEGVVLFDLRFDLLGDRTSPPILFTPFSAFPGAKRDLSFFVPASVAYAGIEETVRSSATPELQKTELLDVFQGEGVPAGQKSLTLRFSFGREDRTLKDTEIVAALARLQKALEDRHGAALRS